MQSAGCSPRFILKVKRGGILAKIEDSILNTIEMMVKEYTRTLQSNRKIEGIISEVVNPSTYKVNVQGNTETIKAMNADTYELNDVVYILVFNNNYSDKKILCRKFNKEVVPEEVIT